MTQAVPQLGLEDAYIYGAWIEDIQLDGPDLRVAVRYSDQQTEFYDLEAQLNLWACTLVFQAVQNSADAESFRLRWEDSDNAWSLASVAADPSGGYGLTTREAGDLLVQCQACVLHDVTPFEPNPRYAAPRSTPRPADGVGRLLDWQQHQYVEGYYTQGRIPPYLLGKRPNKFGYFLLAEGVLGLLLALAFSGPFWSDAPRAENLAMGGTIGLWAFASLLAGCWLLQPPRRG